MAGVLTTNAPRSADIATRLREYAYTAIRGRAFIREAADEIDSLRNRLRIAHAATARQSGYTGCACEMCAQPEREAS